MRIIRARVCLGFAVAAGIALICIYLLNPERRIFAMVEKNQEIYRQVATQLIEEGEQQKLHNVDWIAFSEGEHIMVDFYVTGYGLAPASTYYGFYYSPDDVPLAYGNYDAVLTQYERGAWAWSASGDNKGITKKIASCWYYYEASF